jgi:hypothetical protein
MYVTQKKNRKTTITNYQTHTLFVEEEQEHQ